jgi:hypothetical protein
MASVIEDLTGLPQILEGVEAPSIERRCWGVGRPEDLSGLGEGSDSMTN